MLNWKRRIVFLHRLKEPLLKSRFAGDMWSKPRNITMMRGKAVVILKCSFYFYILDGSHFTQCSIRELCIEGRVNKINGARSFGIHSLLTIINLFDKLVYQSFASKDRSGLFKSHTAKAYKNTCFTLIKLNGFCNALAFFLAPNFHRKTCDIKSKRKKIKAKIGIEIKSLLI